MDSNKIFPAVTTTILTILYLLWLIPAWRDSGFPSIKEKRNTQRATYGNNNYSNDNNGKRGVRRRGSTPPSYSFYIKEPNYNYNNSSLIINTSYGDNFVVKIVDAYNNKDVAIVYIPAGTTEEIEIPSGIYEIRYTSGTEWFGKNELFGPDATYSKADRTFRFTPDEGYEITLYRVPNGNLSTSSIDEEDF